MADLIHQSKFATRLQSQLSLDDALLRNLIFQYCKLYQNDYWFDQLVDAFAYLEMTLGQPADEQQLLETELPRIREDVETTMGEYFISLNEVASAIYRLLDSRRLTINDTLDAIDHVWNAHLCNESPDEFMAREDRILCTLLAESAQFNS